MDPLWKCVGGKRRAAPYIVTHIPHETEVYVEPFLGAGAVMLRLLERSPDVKVVAGDADPTLVATWQQLKDDPQYLWEAVNEDVTAYHASSDKGRLYLETRATFNAAEPQSFTAVRAALMLRATSFNGLWRMSKARMNAPWGKYEKVSLPPRGAYVGVGEALRRAEAIFVAGDFEATLGARPVGARTTYYFDPPYHGGFTAYTRDGFRWADHERLVRMTASLPGRVIYSNANRDDVHRLVERHWGELDELDVTARRTSIACKSDSRGERTDLLLVRGHC